MSSFFQSTSGRMVTASVGVAAFGGGAAIVLGGPAALPIFCVTILAGVVLSLVGLALGVEEGFGGEAALAIILLPILLFLYTQGQGLAMEHHSMGGAYALLAVGLGCLVKAALGSTKATHRSIVATAH